jgi:UDP-N-acetylglucosamine:LPS N-acetylglucosamine transferase
VNLLHVIHYPVFGGPHNQALRLNGPLRERHWNTFVLLPSEPGNAAARLRDGGVPVIQRSLHRVRASRDPRLHLAFVVKFLPEIAGIRRVIRENDIDLVLIGGLINPHAAIAARLEGVPVVWQILDLSTPGPAWRLLRPVVSRCADAIMTAGGAPAEVYLRRPALDVPAFAFFPPVDTDRFRPS